MNLDEETIRSRCTDAVFERAQNYRREGRLQRLRRFDTTVTAAVQGSSLYDVTVELEDDSIETRCTCPYDGPGDCKHAIAVLLESMSEPPADESKRIDGILEEVPAEELRAFMRDVLADHPDLRDQFRARFGDASKSVQDYRDEIEQLFDQHTQDYPVVTEAIDFAHFFEVAEQYRDRDRYAAAATVYRALFEVIDDNMGRIDAAYDHYAQTIQAALDGYVECVRALDPEPQALDTYTGVLEDRATSGPAINSEQFRRALDRLDEVG